MDELRRLWRFVDEHDRDPAAIERSVNLHMHMGTDEADAKRTAEDRVAALGRGARMPSAGALAATPRQAIEMLQAYAEAGASRVSIAIRPPVHWERLQAFVDEVIPAAKN